jgi:hypothetical protein
MAHGHPDYGTDAPLSTVYSIQDLGELAARLGSIVTFDRRGNVLWFDDFENSLNKWYVETLGTGASVAITNDKARRGALACQVITGNATNNYAVITHYEPYPVLSKLGLEFSLLTNVDKATLYAYFIIQTGTHVHNSGIKYDFDDDTWQYHNSAGSWVDLAMPAVLGSSLYLFHTIKLVIDPLTQRYVRLIVDDTSYDMSSLAYRYIATVNIPLVYIQLWLWTQEAAAKTIYFDDVILTQNEP